MTSTQKIKIRTTRHLPAMFWTGLAILSLILPARANANLPSYITSIEYVDVTLSSTTTGSADLSKGQNTDYCVPFATSKQASTDNGTYSSNLLDIYFEAGPKVTVTRADGTGTINVRIYVVEFNPTYVRVQQGTFAVSSGSSYGTTDISTPVNQTVETAAFVSYYKSSSAEEGQGDAALASYFSDTNTLRWERGGHTTGNMSGHFFVFEDIPGDGYDWFSVQHVSISLGTNNSPVDASITNIDMGKTFVIASFKTGYNTGYVRIGQPIAYLYSATAIRGQAPYCDSGKGGGTVIKAFAVTFASAGYETVQRDIFSWGTSGTTKTAGLGTAVDDTISIAWNPMTSTGPGAMAVNNSAGKQAETFQRLTLISSGATIQGDRGVASAASTGPWEVIEFAGPAGPSLTLADHGSGQVSDKFTTTTPVTDVLFRFKLTRGDDTVTVDNLRVNFTTDGGVANGDVTSGELWEDVNGDGAIDGGDSKIQDSVTPSGGVLTFTTNFSPGTGGTNYLVKAMVANLAQGDTTTFSVGTGDIDEVEESVNESGSISDAVHTQDLLPDLTQTHYRWRLDNGYETGGAGTVTLLGSWATPEQDASISYTAPAGTDRVNVLVVSNENSGAYFTTASGCTGNMVRAEYGVGGSNAITVFYEAIGSSASSTNCTLTASGATASNAIITAATFENVVQTEGSAEQTGASLALYNAVGGGANSNTPGSIQLTGSPATPEGGLVVYGITVNGSIQVATPSGFAEEVDQVGGSNVTSGGERTSTTQSDSVTLNVATESSTANRWAAVEIALNPTAGGDPASFDTDMNEDTKLEGLANGTTARLRFLVSNEGLGSDSVTYELQVAQVSSSDGSECAAATYYAINDAGETKWALSGSDYINAGGGDTTSDIDDGTDDALPDPGGGSFVAGYLVDDDDQTASISLDASEFTEIEFAVEANAGDGDEFCFRLGRPDGAALDSYGTYAYALVSIGEGATAVKLVSFSAQGQGNALRLDWVTGHEIANLGFNLYRSQSATGPYVKINAALIPGLDYSALGRAYSYMDSDVSPGTLYYYKLEDIDVYGKHTRHGPVCADWDADGLPDDWELRYGLNPWVYDADLDVDGDGLTNLQEYELDFDPFNPDSDGDGITDGTQAGLVEQPAEEGHRVLTRGVQVIAEDESGVTLELLTDAFDTEVVQTGGLEFERLRIPGYIHGYTAEVGRPEVPLKGILVEIPEGMGTSLRVLETEVETRSGYQLFPRPAAVVDDTGIAAAVAESFRIDQSAYATDGFYPQAAAQLASTYTFRDQKKQQVLFYPISFNAATGELRLYKRIRVRIDYVDDRRAAATDVPPTAWKAPAQNGDLSERLSAAGSLALALGAAPLAAGPLSVAGALSALWAPPAAAGQSVYKVLTAEAGICRIYNDDLALAADLSHIRLYNLGREVAVHVYDQNGNDRLDGADYIEFYAEPVAAAYAKYSRYNVYWLVSSGGTGAPKRMAAISGSPGEAEVAAGHSYLEHQEQDANYNGLAPGADGLDRWFYSQYVLGTGFSGTEDPVPAHFALPVFGHQGPGRLSISLWGYSDVDHEVEVWVNGVYQDTFSWSGIAFMQIEIDNVEVADSLVDQTARGATAGTITLVAEASSVDNAYNQMLIEITAGKGAGQVRKITAYNGTTQVATVASNFSPVPDATSVYRIDTAVTLVCNSGEDAFVVDYFELNYPRNFAAVDDHLQFVHEGGYGYVIDDFSTNDLLVFDISDAAAVARIENASVSGTDPYSLAFDPPGDPGEQRTYLVIGADGYQHPAGISEDVPSDLADTDTRADYILITHKDIGWDGAGDPHSWLQDLVALRESGGLSVKVVDVQDIFDAFSYGLPSPVAIRDFIAYAYGSWRRPAPRYVLLVGDSTYDYKDNLDIGTVNYVPGYMVYTDYMGEAVTDEYFAKVSGGDAVPDLYIGRLPAESPAQAQAMVAKIIYYEQQALEKDWREKVLLIADDHTEDYEQVFETMNEDALALLPAPMVPLRGYLQSSSAAAINSFIDTNIGSGALIVNYSGHGSQRIWANIFRDTDVAGLDNIGKYPFVIGMSCLTGNFSYVDAVNGALPTLAEVLLRADSEGAVAALMPTAMTTTDGQHILNTALFEALFTDDIRQLGPAILSAKQMLLANGGSEYEQISETFLLFGDPAMTLKIPLPRMPAGIEVTRHGNRVRIRWQAALDGDGNPVAGYHVHRAASPGGPYSRINSTLVTGTEYVDTAIAVAGAGSGGGTYYYAVSSQDGDGDESAQSLGVSPASIASSAGGAAGCFIRSAGQSIPAVLFWGLMAFIVVVLLGHWRRVHGARRTVQD